MDLGASPETGPTQRRRVAQQPTPEPDDARSPFEGITRDIRVQQIRRLHAEILELEGGKGERPDNQTRQRIRNRKELLADRLASLGFSRYAEFVASEGDHEVKLIDVRDTPPESRSRPTMNIEGTGENAQLESPRGESARLLESNDALASTTVDSRAPARPPKTAKVSEVNAENIERSTARRGVGVDESTQRTTPRRRKLLRRDRVPAESKVESERSLSDGESPERNAVETGATSRETAITQRPEPVSTGPRGAEVEATYVAVPPRNPVTTPVRHHDDVDRLRLEMATILRDVVVGIRSATVEIQNLAAVARSEREALEAQRRGFDNGASAAVEAARAQALVLRLEAAVADKRSTLAASTIEVESEMAPREFAAATEVLPEPNQPATGTRRRRPRHRRQRVAVVAVSTAAISVGAVAAVSYAMTTRKEPTLASPSERLAEARNAPAVAGRLLPRDASVRAKTTAPSTATPTTAKRSSPPSTKPGAATSKAPPAVAAAPTDPAVENAYAAGYKAECQALWGHAGPDGLLWDPDDRESGGHKIDECLSSLDTTNAGSYDNAKDATAGGSSDADSAAGGLVSGTQLAPTNGAAFDIPQ